MPINPIRVNPIDAPPPPRPMPAVDFSGISSLGDSIGRYREQQELSQIMASAIDPRTGALDLQKAASAIAITGRDPTRLIAAWTAQQSEKRGEAAQRALEAHYTTQAAAEQERLKLARDTFERSGQTFVPPTLLNEGYFVAHPRAPGQAPVITPAPRPGGGLGSGPGPQSSAEDVLPPAAQAAAAGPAMGERLPANFYPPPGGPPTPSEGPPLAPQQMAQAAPPVPQPAQPAPTPRPSQPAPASLIEPLPAPPAAATPTPRNEAILARIPEAGRVLVKAVAEYQIDPDKLGKDKEEIIAAAKLYRPDYSTAEYQKRQNPLPAEVSSRIGLARAFLDKLDDRRDEQGNFIPGIKSRIAAGEMTGTLQGRAAAVFGQGEPGALRAAIDEGAEALLRALTGAGMSVSEAGNYVRRYQFSPIDDVAGGVRTSTNKLNGLETALRYTSTEMQKGHGGEDFLKGFRSKFGEGSAIPRVKDEAEASQAIGHAQEALQKKWKTRDFLVEDLRRRGIANPERYLPGP